MTFSFEIYGVARALRRGVRVNKLFLARSFMSSEFDLHWMDVPYFRSCGTSELRLVNYYMKAQTSSARKCRENYQPTYVQCRTHAALKVSARPTGRIKSGYLCQFIFDHLEPFPVPQ